MTLEQDDPLDPSIVVPAAIRSSALFRPHRALGGGIAVPVAFAAAEAPGARLVLVLGPNASGKSLIRRAIVNVVRHRGVPWPIELSMEARTRVRAVVEYGMESVESTGANSARALLNAIAKMKRPRARPTVAVLDEPDLGSSEAAAAGVGRALGDLLLDPAAASVRSLYLTTHSRPLLFALLEAAGGLRAVHVVLLGDPELVDAAPVDVQTAAHALVYGAHLDAAVTPDQVLARGLETFNRAKRVLRSEARVNNRRRREK